MEVITTQNFESLLDRDFSFLQCSCRHGPHAEEYFETRLSLEILFALWQRQSHAQPRALLANANPVSSQRIVQGHQMSPHQHGQVGIGIFQIGLMSWLFSGQNSALLSLPFQMQKFLNGIIAFSSPFTKANDSAWFGMRITIRILDHAAKLRVPLMPGLLEALLRKLSLVGRK